MKQKKQSRKKVVTKRGSASLDFKKIIIYIFALAVIIAIYLYLANVGRMQDTSTDRTRLDSFIERPDREPVFRKDSELSFLKLDGTLITTIEIEIANTTASRMQGLMFRQSMAMNRGMLFIFEFSHNIEMWMRNTYIPLDMIFVREDKTIAHIETNTVPFLEETIYCPVPVKYVIEVNAGFTERYGIEPGQMIDWY
ncbi:MAG: DUF192 domain-containing protein [Candidatus Cloacimonetes bacterium]|nr:DUF192 domain-containing protein [Candidatus Cloacimonadota bacterium]